MCEELEVKFIVPKKPTAGIGWWIGLLINTEGRFCMINIVWADISEYEGTTLCTMPECFEEFDTLIKAFDYLKAERIPALRKPILV